MVPQCAQSHGSESTKSPSPIERFRRVLEAYAPSTMDSSISPSKGRTRSGRSRVSDELAHYRAEFLPLPGRPGIKARDARSGNLRVRLLEDDRLFSRRARRLSIAARQYRSTFPLPKDRSRPEESRRALPSRYSPDGPASLGRLFGYLRRSDGRQSGRGGLAALSRHWPTPGDTELVAPLVLDEMIIRLSAQARSAPPSSSISVKDAGTYGVARAVALLQSNYSKPMQVEKIAEIAHMSPSSFHQHFKAVTSMSPLQYQTDLEAPGGQAAHALEDAGCRRCLPARRLCERSSQFSREYSRFLSGPRSTKDIVRSAREKLRISGERQGAN